MPDYISKGGNWVPKVKEVEVVEKPKAKPAKKKAEKPVVETKTVEEKDSSI